MLQNSGSRSLTRVGLTQGGDANRLSYAVDHGKGLLIVVQIKCNRGLVRQFIARGLYPLDHRAAQRGKRGLGRAFEFMEARDGVAGVGLKVRWLGGRRVDLRWLWHLLLPHWWLRAKARR